MGSDYYLVNKDTKLALELISGAWWRMARGPNEFTFLRFTEIIGYDLFGWDPSTVLNAWYTLLYSDSGSLATLKKQRVLEVTVQQAFAMLASDLPKREVDKPAHVLQRKVGIVHEEVFWDLRDRDGYVLWDSLYEVHARQPRFTVRYEAATRRFHVAPVPAPGTEVEIAYDDNDHGNIYERGQFFELIERGVIDEGYAYPARRTGYGFNANVIYDTAIRWPDADLPSWATYVVWNPPDEERPDE